MAAVFTVVICCSLDEDEDEDDAWDSVEVERDFCSADKGTCKLSNVLSFSVDDWIDELVGWTKDFD